MIQDLEAFPVNSQIQGATGRTSGLVLVSFNFLLVYFVSSRLYITLNQPLFLVVEVELG